jgi:xanthine dehydrogenase accessory factor
MLIFFQSLVNFLEQEPIALATVIQVKGSAPREVGTIMAIGRGGRTTGTIGGGAGEAKVIQQALSTLETGRKELVEIDLTGAPTRDIQGVCGGKMQVWVERWQKEQLPLVHQIVEQLQGGQSATLVIPLEQQRSSYLQSPPLPSPAATSEFFLALIPPPTLLIIGAGHCAVPLAHLAYLTGFRVVVQDDRPEFASRERFPEAAEVLTVAIEEAVKSLPSTDCYAALVTRGYTQDLIALRALIHFSWKYIGMIGSTKRVKTVFQELEQNGFDHAFLEQIHAPIGLDIGAQTPEEIAVSICAELIMIRRGGIGRSLSQPYR